MCELCNFTYTPTSPKQKYCSNCTDEAKRNRGRVHDLKRSRKNNKYDLQEKTCPICGIKFTTYYTNKIYCGSELCEKERIRIKNANMHKRRSKDTERLRKKDYYDRTQKQRLLQKAIKYREANNTVIEYSPRGFYSHDIDFVRNYFSKFGYVLLSDVYNNNREKLIVLCPEGHEWETTFHGFKDAGNRCLQCYSENNYTSIPEQKLVDYFQNNFPDVTFIHNDREQITPYELDLFFPDINVAIEVCGLYWHSEVSGKKDKKYHYNKMQLCKDKRIRLITVFEDEINNKFDIVISRIKVALGLVTERIFARKCEVRNISVHKANNFFEDTHIQGPAVCKKALGLFYNDKLVAACSVGSTGREHAGGENVIELKRFSVKLGCVVVGGFSKLFKVIINEWKNFNIKSYCDMRYANIFNPVYEKAGFKLVGAAKYTPHYVKAGKRYRNISLRKTPEERKTGLTKWELRLAQGYDRIWDCGYRTYIFENGDLK